MELNTDYILKNDLGLNDVRPKTKNEKNIILKSSLVLRLMSKSLKSLYYSLFRLRSVSFK